MHARKISKIMDYALTMRILSLELMIPVVLVYRKVVNSLAGYGEIFLETLLQVV